MEPKASDSGGIDADCKDRVSRPVAVGVTRRFLANLPQSSDPTTQVQVTAVQLDEEMHYLKDHVVCGQVVLPAATQLAWVLRAVQRRLGDASVALEAVRFHAPLVITDNNLTAIHLACYSAASEFALINARGRGSDQIDVLCTGRYEGGRLERSAPFDLTRAIARYSNQLAAPQLYSLFGRCSLEYGASFRRIESLLWGPKEVLALLTVPPVTLAQAALQPTVLDACFQSVVAVLPDFIEISGSSPMLPARIKRISLLELNAQPRCCIVAARTVSKRAIVSDIYLCSGEGRAILKVEGLTCVRSSIREQPIAVGA